MTKFCSCRRRPESPRRCHTPGRYRHLLACSGSRHDASRSWLEHLGSRSCRSPRSRKMAHSLDAEVKAFRTRPLDSGPYPIVWADALVVKVREAGRTVNVHVLVVTGVNAEGHLRDPRRRGCHQRGCGRLARLLALACGTRAHRGGTRDLEMRTVASSRRSARRCQGPPGSGVAPTTCGICSPRWRGRKQPSSGNPGAHHLRPAGRHRGGGSVPTSG